MGLSERPCVYSCGLRVLTERLKGRSGQREEKEKERNVTALLLTSFFLFNRLMSLIYLHSFDDCFCLLFSEESHWEICCPSNGMTHTHTSHMTDDVTNEHLVILLKKTTEAVVESVKVKNTTQLPVFTCSPDVSVCRPERETVCVQHLCP